MAVLNETEMPRDASLEDLVEQSLLIELVDQPLQHVTLMKVANAGLAVPRRDEPPASGGRQVASAARRDE